jgi:3-hydroxyacyl-CoA dehydrogenase/3a,7a,12a-trihydroxy-5b-cholest-24-enoyl-CoA hydratase
MAMATGQADPMKLFSTGKLKISGDVMASQKLGFLKKITPDLVMAEMKKRAHGRRWCGGGRRGRGGAGGARRRGTMVPTTCRRVHRDPRPSSSATPSWSGRSAPVYLFKVTNPDSSTWVIDLKNGKGAVTEGARRGRLHARDQRERDFIDMTTGKSDPMKLFTTGKLKISGNVMASQKLELPAEDGSRAGQAGGDQGARGGRRSGQGRGAALGRPPRGPPDGQGAGAIFAALGQAAGGRSRSWLPRSWARSVLFKIVDPGSEWTVEGGGGVAGRLRHGHHDDHAQATRTWRALSAGDRLRCSLYQHGKLRVDGDDRRRAPPGAPEGPPVINRPDHTAREGEQS